MIENHSPPQTLDEVIRWLTQQSRRAKSSSHDSGSERSHADGESASLPRFDRRVSAQQAARN